MAKVENIGIIGGGNMGEAIAAGIITSKLLPPDHLIISDPVAERREHLHSRYRVAVTEDNHELLQASNIVILAVKPQKMKSVIEEFSSNIDGRKLFISVAAGMTLTLLEETLGSGIPVIRVMPNMPALIGESATAMATGQWATDEDLETARRIFDSIGITVIVDEVLMDSVTGLSGSGPAYGFIIIEALADAGVQMGLDRAVAVTLAAQTLLGAAKLCLKGEKTPGQLKDMVTSPGGTTITGIKALEEGKIRATLMSAVEAATERSRKLGS